MTSKIADSATALYLATLASISYENPKFFDSGNSNWSPHREYNLLFLRAQQAYFNDLLRSRGNVFLNEVYDALGLPRTRVAALIGWIGDSVIDFGVAETGEGTNTFALTFNVDDGTIWEKL